MFNLMPLGFGYYRFLGYWKLAIGYYISNYEWHKRVRRCNRRKIQ